MKIQYTMAQPASTQTVVRQAAEKARVYKKNGRAPQRTTGQIVFARLVPVLLALLAGFGAAWHEEAFRQKPAAIYSKMMVAAKPAQSVRDLLESPAQRLANEPFLHLFNEWNPIPTEAVFLLDVVGNTSMKMQPEAARQLQKMLEAGTAQGLNLVIRSAYRSHEQQQSNFNRKLKEYLGQGLEQSVAEEYTRASIATPGRSEHQTGLAADLATPGGRVLGPWFAQTPEYEWLVQNCATYGFILRYPKDRQDVTGVYYEPWHYRYVGTQYAQEIAQSGLTMEEYLQAAGVNITPTLL